MLHGRKLALVIACATVCACVDKPLPRSFTEFMEDNLAREGVLARCNVDREATANDPECVNARRAAAAVAAQAEVGQRDHREAQSEARRLAARQRADAQTAAQEQAAIVAEEEKQIAYDAQWDETVATTTASEPSAGSVTPVPAPAPIADAVEAPAPLPALEPVTLPASIRPPLTTITLPRGVKPLEYAPPKPVLEEIVVPSRLKGTD